MAGRTFFRYKARIIREEQELCEKTAIDSPKYRFMELIRSLEEAVILSKRIRDNTSLKAKYRMEASDNVIRCARYLYQLSNHVP